jgi:5S rRNA maturation endonuclease (ribonuclease M5)
MDYKKSLDELEKIITEINEANIKTPIIVEGEKDILALRKLDMKGQIITVNSGVSLTDFCDKVADDFNEVILLTDWDRKGGFLCHTIQKNLEGRVICNTYFREFFAKNTTIKTVEGLPSYITTLKEKVSKIF